jgi:hypothetical protein
LEHSPFVIPTKKQLIQVAFCTERFIIFATSYLTLGLTPTLERTGAHELGHSGGLRHPTRGTAPDNVMNQAQELDAGKKITQEQILTIKDAYDKGKLNKQTKRDYTH